MLGPAARQLRRDGQPDRRVIGELDLDREDVAGLPVLVVERASD